MRPVIVSNEAEEYKQWLLTEYVPISGGDGTDDQGGGDGDGDPDDGGGSTDDDSSGNATGSSDSTGTEPKDEKGVALKNRLAEEKRKREKAERERDDERLRAQAERAERERLESLGRQKEEPDEDLGSLQFSDPEAYATRLAKRAAEEAVAATRQEIANTNRAKEIETTLAQLKEEYPELDDPDSEFYSEVDKEYTAKVRKFGHDAGILRDTVQLLAYRKAKKPVQRSTERPPVGETGGSRQSDRGRPGKVTDINKQVGKALGLSEKSVAKAYARDLSSEIMGASSRG